MSEQQVQTEQDNTQSIEAEAPEQAEIEEQIQDGSPPPGWKSYEQYVSDGGDPEEFKGAKVFSREYEKIIESRTTKAEKKALERTLKEMGQNVSVVLRQQKEHFQQSIVDKNAQKDTQIAQLSADLMKAHEDMDTRKTEKLTKEINKLEATKVEAQPNQEARPFTAAEEALSEFIQENEILNPNSGSFDKELENAVAEQLRAKFNPNLKPYAAAKLFDRALADAKKEIPRFNQKEVKRASNTGQPGTKGVKGGKPSVNSLPREAKEMHDYLLNNMGNPKQGKEAADNFLKNWSV